MFDGVVLIDEHGQIASVEERPDAGRSPPFIFPGFVDLQLYDTRHAVANGVTTYLATCGTSPPGVVDAFLTSLPVETSCFGAHIEGPYLNPDAAGAHPVEEIRAVDHAELGAWLATGRVRMVTVAPEASGALEAIELIREAGAVAAVGHTHADPRLVGEAVDAGATFATHVWNAMGPASSRAPGPAATLIADQRVTLGLIADGRHLHPIIEELTIRAAGASRVAITSDLIAPPREDDAGEPVGGDLCGAALVERSARIGLREAAMMASLVPSLLLGLTDRGRVAPGFRADLALVSREFRPVETIVAGAVAAATDTRTDR